MRIFNFTASHHGLTGAVFMIGLAILFATDWIWPGILVLVGVTSLLGAYVKRATPDDDDIPLRVDNPDEESPQLVRYVAQCASCGATTPQEFADRTTAQQVGFCSFCGTQLDRAE